MSGALGLSNNFNEVVTRPWVKMRGSVPGKIGGNDVSLQDFIQYHAGPEGRGLRNASNGQPVTLDDIWRDFGVNPLNTTLSNLIALGAGGAGLAEVTVLDAIMTGVRAKPWYQYVCRATVPAASMDVRAPYGQFEDAEPLQTAEAETIAEGSLTSGTKVVPLRKYSIGITLTMEMIFASSLPLVQGWLEEVGHRVSANRNRRCVQTVVNGDQGKDSETGLVVDDSCAVIGVADTEKGIQFRDFTRPWARASSLYIDWETLITSEDTAVDVLDIPQFIEPKAGDTLVTVDSVSRIIPARMPHLVSSEVAVGDFCLLDRLWTMYHSEFVPPFVDFQHWASNQTDFHSVTFIDGFVTAHRKGRVMVRSSLPFATNGFPSYMEPLD